MKRLLCSVLALMLLMLGTCTPALAEKLVDSGDFGTIHWELDSNGKLSVTGTGTMENITGLEYYRNRNKIKTQIAITSWTPRGKKTLVTDGATGSIRERGCRSRQAANTQSRKESNSSSGVRYPSFLRGRPFSSSAATRISSSVKSSIETPFGTKARNRPLCRSF